MSKIEISGITPEQVIDSIAMHYFHDYEIGEKATAEIHSTIRSRLRDILDATIKEEARAIVGEQLRGGWVLHHPYGGEPKTVTLTQLIVETLKAKSKRGGFGSSQPERTFIENVVTEEVESYVKSTLKDDLKEARDLFRAQVNRVLQSKLAETLAEHLGIGGK